MGVKIYQLLHTIRALLIVCTVLAGLNLILVLAGSINKNKDIQPLNSEIQPLVIENIVATTSIATVEPKATSTTITEKPKEVVPPKEEKVVATIAPKAEPVVSQAEPVKPKEFLPTEAINIVARDAVVNILCTSPRSGAFHPISGSGVIIDSRGVILTNAHVAQFFLLNEETDCVIRTGSPAKNKYHAELLFLPPAWIEANAKSITEQSPFGTGENDYALLRITESVVNTAPLPEVFTHLPVGPKDTIDSTNRMLVVAYPSELIGAIATQLNLFQVSTTAEVTRAFYFGDDQDSPAIDLISIGGSIVAQGGSSGGAIIDLEDGKVLGIIVTSTRGETTEKKDLRGVTLSHINRSIQNYTQLSLSDFISQDLETLGRWFNQNLFAKLRASLTGALGI
ncbi:MAG: trypsin-like peptidase domain-containing protein [bacterium]|nr:trypsin-like peptidase domain-containing protein [bacterium]